MEIYVKEKPFIEDIKKRIRKNENCLIIVVGRTGVGKSYASMRIAEVLDSGFGLDRIAFKGKDFIEIADRDLPKGSVIMLDEAGISMDNRTWWETHNRMINYLLQTFRHRNLIAILTVPQLNFIDKKSLALFHIVLEVVGKNMAHRFAVVKPKHIIARPTNLTDKNFLMMFPMIKDNAGSLVKVTRLRVKLPSLRLRHDYEKVKSKFTSDLRNDSLIAMGGEGKLGTDNLVASPGKRERELLVLLKKYPNLKNKELAEMIGITANNVNTIKQNLKAKKLINK